MVGGSGSVAINQRYEMATIDATVLSALFTQVQSGGFLLHDFIRYQQKIGLVAPDKTPEQVESELRDQQPLPGTTGLDSSISEGIDDN